MTKQSYYELAHHQIQLNPFPTTEFILDIGGGGEGVIAQLMGNQVIAIDLRRDELEETDNDALKIVMDASDLQFLDASFHMVTAFYTFMYIPIASHQKVFKEVYRVLKPGGRFLVWDGQMPTKPNTEHDIVVMTSTISMPGKTIETGYGCHWPTKALDLDHYLAMGKEHGFSPIKRNGEAGKIFIEFVK